MSTAHILSHFERVDPLLAAAFKTMQRGVLVPNLDHTTYFSRLTHEIIGQQLSGKAADTIIGRFLSLFPNRLVTPEGVLARTEDELRAVGMSWAKVRYVRDLASKVVQKELIFDDFSTLSDVLVIERLRTVKGIGMWTAEMFLLFTLGREDVFSFGDLTLKKGLERIYGKHRTATKRRVENITERWAPYRSYGSLALWHVLDSEKSS